MPLTPSTHRQRIGEPSGIGLSTVPGLVTGIHSPHFALQPQAPLSGLPGNHNAAKFPAVGLSSGLKSSHNGGGSFADFAVPARPQGIDPYPYLVKGMPIIQH